MSLSIESARPVRPARPVRHGLGTNRNSATLQEALGVAGTVALEEQQRNEELLRQANDPLSVTLDCKEMKILCSTTKALWESPLCIQKTFLCKVDHLIRSRIYEDIANSAALEYDETRKNFDSNLFNFVEDLKFQDFQEKAVDEAIASLTADIANFEERVSFKRVLLLLRQTANSEQKLKALEAKIIPEIPLIRLVRVRKKDYHFNVDVPFYEDPSYWRTSLKIRADYDAILSAQAMGDIRARLVKEVDHCARWFKYGVLIEGKLRIFQDRFKDCVAKFCEVNHKCTIGSMYHINKWDVSHVTDMSLAFEDKVSFNEPLHDWDVSNVTNMTGMFDGATDFNRPLENWDVSNVTHMTGMFDGATDFNQPLKKWKDKLKKVTDMVYMFCGATSFNQSLYYWNVANVTDMAYMFCGATSFNQSLNAWNVTNVTDMAYMFCNATSFNQDLDNWNLENLSGDTCEGMFEGAINFKSKPPQKLSGGRR